MAQFESVNKINMFLADKSNLGVRRYDSDLVICANQSAIILNICISATKRLGMNQY